MKKLIKISVIALILLLAFDLFFVHSHHPYFKWQTWKGFYALLGFATSISLMFFAKFIGRFFLYRNTDYYEDK